MPTITPPRRIIATHVHAELELRPLRLPRRAIYRLREKIIELMIGGDGFVELVADPSHLLDQFGLRSVDAFREFFVTPVRRLVYIRFATVQLVLS